MLYCCWGSGQVVVYWRIGVLVVYCTVEAGLYCTLDDVVEYCTGLVPELYCTCAPVLVPVYCWTCAPVLVPVVYWTGWPAATALYWGAGITCWLFATTLLYASGCVDVGVLGVPVLDVGAGGGGGGGAKEV